MRLFLAIFMVLLLVGWTDPEAQWSDVETLSVDGSKQPGKATIVLFRGSGGSGAARSFTVSIDGNRLGTVRRERYLASDVAPGFHTIKIECGRLCDLPDIQVRARFKAGRTYFFLTQPDFESDSSTWTFISSVRQISGGEASTLLRTYRLGKAETAAP
jgi:hypothetical protein